MERERRKEKRNERDEREENLKKCDAMRCKERSPDHNENPLSFALSKILT